MKTEREICYVSEWTKGDKTCKVHSARKDGNKKANVWFTGWNPFPCFAMETTATCVIKWLKANGWERKVNGSITMFNDTIDEETGEVVDHTTTVYNYIPVTENKETIPELLRQGRRSHAVKVYRDITGCTLKEAIDYVDSVRGKMNL